MEAALKTMGTMKPVEKDDYFRCAALTEIAKFQLKAGDQAGARKSLQQALRVADSVQAGAGTEIIVLNEIAEAQAEAGDLEAAQETFRLARQKADAYMDESYRAVHLQGIAHSQAKAGQKQEALQWTRSLSEPVAKAAALVGIARGILEKSEPKIR